jgi:predicted esterase
MQGSRLVLLASIALCGSACGEVTQRLDARASRIDTGTTPIRDGSTAMRDGGQAMHDGSTDHDAGIGTDATPTLAPIIPEPAGECPTFASGEQTIMDLETDILAGVPGAEKGPLLVTWHGTGGNGSWALIQLPRSVRDDIEAQGGIVIAPNDNGEARVGYSPNGVWYETSDLEYADHIVACAVRDHNVDPRRIYATGCSAGGLMAAAMAVKRSAYVAAAYPESGGLVTTVGVALQDPTRVPAVLTMHGGPADTVIVNFQETSGRLLDFIKLAGGFGVDCNHESGHCGAPTDLREYGWEFVESHPFGTAPSPYAAGLPASYPDYCIIW